MRFLTNKKTRFAGPLAALASVGIAALAPGAAQAQTLYGIGQDLWKFDLSSGTAVATKINTSAFTWTPYTYTRNGTSNNSNGNGNGLAFDNVHNALIYADGGTRTLYSYSLSTGATTNLGTLSTVAGYDLSAYNLQGSASFYNGKYYLMPELNNYQTAASSATQPWNLMMSVTLNAAGTGIASTAIVGGTSDSPNSQWGTNVTNGFGDGGDMAIDKNGKVYGFSSAVTNPTGTTSVTGYYTANVNTPTSGVTSVSTSTANTGGQAAYQNGVLYHSTATTTGGVTTYTIESRNQATGAIIQTYNLSGFTDTVGIADMASPLETPEPGSVALMISAGALPLGGLGLRRLRRTEQKGAASAA